MTIKLSIVIFCIIVSFCTAAKRPKSTSSSTYVPHYFTQKVDHFNPEDTRTFQQKYYINDTFWNGQSGSPIFLEISGEAPCSGVPNNNVLYLANAFNALVVTVEHRYYGESMPVADLSLPNLQYLTTKQALEDLAYFIYYFETSVLNDTSSPWITFGCSYAGALAAWFRLKYPHLTIGAVSSSGVVNAVLDFYEFDEQVSMSVGPVCTTALQKITSLIEDKLEESPSSNNQTKTAFLAPGFTDGDFYWLIADIAAESVQYGYQDLLCNSIVGAPDPVQAYLNFSLNFYYPVFLGGDVYSYSTIHLQDTSASNGDRTWWWQECSELGYFQNAPQTNSIRSSYVNMTYHQWRCGTAYAPGTWPDTIATNNYYGGANIQGTAIFFINSSQDPWQWAGVRESPNWFEPATIVVCHNCGHCSELRGCPSIPGMNVFDGCDDMHEVNRVRGEVYGFVDGLLQSFRKQN